MDDAKTIITDHAVLRLLERGYGVDVEGLRRFMAERLARGIEVGAPKVVIGHMKYVLKAGQCVTVMEQPLWSKTPANKSRIDRHNRHKRRAYERRLRGE